MAKKTLKGMSLEKLGKLAREGVARKPLLSRMELEVEELKRQVGQSEMDKKLESLPPEDGRPKACPLCGQPARVRSRHLPRTFQSLSGTHTIRRHFHYCERCRAGFYPLDSFLGLPKEGELSEELERRAADFAVNDVYQLAERRWNFHYPHHVSDNLFRQVAKRLGQMAEDADTRLLHSSVLPPEATAPDTLYVMNDGGMVPMREGRWNEVKLGVLFRAEDHLSHREVKRGMLTRARYVATLGEQTEFKDELKTAYELENGTEARRVVWLADGAHGNWNLASVISPKAIQILDWHHAIENGMKCARVLLGEQHPLLCSWQKRLESLLWPGEVEVVIRELLECKQLADPAGRKAIEDLVRYYRTNQERMQYARFVSEGLLIGSGIVESGHRHIIQVRMKRAGQHWGPRGARQMARLRAAYGTCGPERFYESVRWAYRTTLRATRLLPRKHKVDLRRRGMATR